MPTEGIESITSYFSQGEKDDRTPYEQMGTFNDGSRWCG